MRRLFIDIETGGLLPAKEHPILEIGARCEQDEDDPNAVEFSVVIAHDAETWATCSEHALKVNQFTFEECQQIGVPLREAADRFAGWLVRNDINNQTAVWVGQNPSFDLAYLSEYMREHLEFVGLLPDPKVENVMDMAKALGRKNPSFKPQSFSGGNIALALGLIPEDILHRALGGVAAVRQNYYMLQKRLEAYSPERLPR